MFVSLGRLLYKKHIVLNLIIVVQLTIALLIGNILLGNYNKMSAPTAFLSEFNENTAFFSPMRIAGKPKIDIDYSLLTNEGTVIEFLPKSVETYSVNVFCYGPYTCNILKTQLKNGEWTPGVNGNGEINCVTIGNAYRKGDSFTEQIGNKVFVFRVVGTFGNTAVVINSARSSSEMRANVLLTEYDSSAYGTAIVCCSESIATEAATYGNAMVYSLSNISSQHLKNNGKLTTIQQIKNNSCEELQLSIRSYLPLAICFGLSGLLATISMTCLNLLKDKKVYDVYFVCGMNKKDAFLLNLGYMVWMVISVIIFTLILYLICVLSGIIMQSDYLIGANQFVFSITYLFVLTLFTSVLSMIVMKPKNISESK